MTGNATLGVILAGGRSTRMGTEKALLPIAGASLITHVVSRFAPQVGRLVINANGDPARFAALGLAVIGDCSTGEQEFEYQGPLAGIAAALALAARSGFPHVATVPVDAPLLPLDLVERLAAGGSDDEIASAAGVNGIEPLFALWPTSLAPAVDAALAAGERAVRRLVEGLPHRLVAFTWEASEASPFLNLNTPADATTFEHRHPSSRS